MNTPRKILRRLLAAAAVVALILAGCAGLNFLLVDDTATNTRLMMHDFYRQEEIDILVVGASRVYHSFIPSLLEELTGERFFCAASADQQPDASLALIKEAVKRYHLKHIYMDMSLDMAEIAKDRDQRTTLTSTYLVSDYMRPSLNKLRFLLQASSPDHYVNSFFPARRYWDMATQPGAVADLVREKTGALYRSYSPDGPANEIFRYGGRGYMVFQGSFDTPLISSSLLDREEFTAGDDWRACVQEVIAFCQEEKIPLTLFSPPVTDLLLAEQRDYDSFIDYIQDMVAGTEAEYVDFNLVSREYISRDRRYFTNSDHLNDDGAQLFSAFLARYLAGQIPESAFYPTVKARLEAQEPCFYGAAKEEGQELSLWPVSNFPELFEYQVTLTPEGGEPSLCRDLGPGSMVTLPLDWRGTVTFTARRTDGSAPETVLAFPITGAEEKDM